MRSEIPKNFVTLTFRADPGPIEERTLEVVSKLEAARKDWVAAWREKFPSEEPEVVEVEASLRGAQLRLGGELIAVMIMRFTAVPLAGQMLAEWPL